MSCSTFNKRGEKMLVPAMTYRLTCMEVPFGKDEIVSLQESLEAHDLMCNEETLNKAAPIIKALIDRWDNSQEYGFIAYDAGGEAILHKLGLPAPTNSNKYAIVVGWHIASEEALAKFIENIQIPVATSIFVIRYASVTSRASIIPDGIFFLS